MDDDERFPEHMRGDDLMVARWKQAAEQHVYDLHEEEVEWRDRRAWLLTRGYELRPRYRPGWRPSWEGTNINPGLGRVDGERPLSALSSL